MNDETRILLPEKDLPTAWYNIMPDLPNPLPPVLHPATIQPVGPEDLLPLFPMSLIKQEVSQESYIEIPEAVREVYRLWRPSPLIRARRLEKVLDTPARIYYKHEGLSPVGSHKPNTAVAQAYYCKQEGVRRLTTETGAGQWGSALAMGGAFFDLDVKVYMVKISYQQKPYRRILMESFGAQVTPSPSEETKAGRKILAGDPDSLGSLGVAISEAVEVAANDEETKYSLGSVLNHVMLHQTVVGEEALKQFAMVGDYPDVVIGCVGGGSNYAGLAFPFIREKLKNGRETRFVSVEPEACPSMTRGVYAYDMGDTVGMAPLVKMYTLGHTFIPAGIHAGGLRYHGMAPSVSVLRHVGIIDVQAYYQNTVFEAAVTFTRAEGVIPAPESAHAVRAAIDQALEAKALGEERAILFNLSGHGHFDLAAYDEYLNGRLQDYAYPEDAVREAMQHLPQVTEPA
ncbi:MAG: TrpB-like pyridoxal phosphate-dependent enzyme [Anaerolineae bacterium]|jgi:tryptophan synthase beta chain